MDRIAEESLLYDFYGSLLTERQREATRLYHEENYSLSEIAAEFGISRQGVHDALKTAEKSLAEYEEKLGLVRRFAETGRILSDARERLERAAEKSAGNEALVSEIDAVKDMLAEIEL